MGWDVLLVITFMFQTYQDQVYFFVIKNEDCGQENGAISNITVTSTADSISFIGTISYPIL